MYDHLVVCVCVCDFIKNNDRRRVWLDESDESIDNAKKSIKWFKHTLYVL